MGIVRTTAPAAALLTLDEAKRHLRIEDSLTDEDDLVSSLVDAAVAQVEAHCHRALLEQTWQLTLDGFPSCDRPIRLPWPNLLGVTSVKYIDDDGAEQTMAPADYIADTTTLPGEIALAFGKSWPTARCQRNAVTIVYRAGYGDTPAAVPAPIRAAALLVLGDLYANREAQIVGTIVAENPAVAALLGSYLYREAA